LHTPWGLVADRFLFEALVRFPVAGKRVLIIGSVRPTYEVFALAFHAREVVVSEYNIPAILSDSGSATAVPRLRYVTPSQLRSSGDRFDVCLSISSIEHDGLGRYGDPLSHSR
jgi:hypothetical protein